MGTFSATLARMKSALVPGALAVTLFSCSMLLPAQVPAYAPSTEIHPDRTVTFRYKDDGATKVLLGLEGVAKPIPMTKDPAGIWTVTTAPLAPEIYGYHYEVDGQPRLDLANIHLTPNLVNLSNLLTVPGDAPQPWDDTNVPHGILHHHNYTSAAVLGLNNHQSDYFVYTPPGYDPKGKTPYPVLYLLHGWSDGASGWSAVGQANFIFDNLLAQKKIQPMVVVMPLGYGDMAFLHSWNVWQETMTIDHNTNLFSQALLGEVMPQVESAYNVSRKREDRAIVGLSMGGLESLSVGLTNTDRFAWIGGFSSAVHKFNLENGPLASLDPKTANLRLLWIACGTEDGLIDANRRFVTFLKSKDMPVTQIETSGMHTWMVWRDNLVHFAPLLFQSK
jgi:enterochelin esterase-like enzyme